MNAHSPQKQARWRKRAPWIIVPLLAFFALASWAYSSPVGSSPDDDFHLASIWCGLGERDGLCETADSGPGAKLPHDLVIDSVCFVFDSAKSAGCQSTLEGGSLVEWVRGNFDASYPPVFYATMSIFASDNIETSVLIMRLFNAALFVGLITALFALLPIVHRPALLIQFVATVVPLGMFIIPSTNPSSWAIISAGVVWISVVGYLESTGFRRILFATIAGIGVVVGAGARADSAGYVGIAVIAVLIVRAKRSRAFLLASLFPVLLVCVALAFYLSAGQSTAAVEGLGTSAQPSNLTFLAITNFINVPELWAGFLGQWRLGWIDTTLPHVVWVLGLGAAAALAFNGISAGGPRKYLAIGFLTACLWAVPTVLLTQSGALVGDAVQPRYILPLAVLLAGFVYLRSTRSQLVPNRVQLLALVLAIAVANSVALYFNIRRYVFGSDGGLNINAHVEWWWANIPSPIVMWSAGSLCFAACLVLLAFYFRRSGRTASSIESDAPSPFTDEWSHTDSSSAPQIQPSKPILPG
ncbi:DUF2142 domain-containing protein [Okibacterium endophyticum]